MPQTILQGGFQIGLQYSGCWRTRDLYWKYEGHLVGKWGLKDGDFQNRHIEMSFQIAFQYAHGNSRFPSAFSIHLMCTWRESRNLDSIPFFMCTSTAYGNENFMCISRIHSLHVHIQLHMEIWGNMWKYVHMEICGWII